MKKQLAPAGLRFVVSFLFAVILYCFTISPAMAEPDWKGFYGGISLGYMNTDAVASGHIEDGPYWVPMDIPQVGAVISNDSGDEVISGSLFGGWDHQMGAWVLGLGVKITLADADNEYQSGSVEYDYNPGVFFRTATKIKSDWMVSLAPRLGYAYENSLLYVFGGLAASRFTYNFQYEDDYTGFSGPAIAGFSKSKKKLGWTAGLGYEYRMNGGWGIMAEYTHYEFDDIFDRSFTPLVNEPSDGLYQGIDSYRADAFQIGVVKHF